MGNMSMQSSRSSNKKTNKKKTNPREFIIDLDRIEMVGKTTLMIKNIPNRYNKSMLLRTLNKNHAGKFDFFYLPIDFKVTHFNTHNRIIRINAMLDMPSLTLLIPNISSLSIWSLTTRSGRSSIVIR